MRGVPADPAGTSGRSYARRPASSPGGLQRLRCLASATRDLAGAEDYEQTLEAVARVALPGRGDWALVDVTEPDGTIRRVAAVHPDPEKQVLARALDPGWPPGPDGVSGPVSVMATREPSALVGRALKAGARGVHRSLLERIGVTAALMVPLVVEDEVLGAITFLSERSGAGFSGGDLALADELAATCALALRQMRVVAELERSVVLRDQVLGYVSHDLKNPLGAIMLAASQMVVEADLGSDDPWVKRQHDSAERILTAATRMQRLIGDLLEVARIGAGGLIIERRRIHVAELMDDVRRGCEAGLTARSLKLEVIVSPGLPTLEADADRLLQVFDNLLENAAKFTPAGGTVTIGAVPFDDSVLFSVADTGIGVQEQDVTRLFDRFWQRRRTGAGSAGLGLAISRGIVASHGGAIWVESEAGQGSTFYFRVPLTAGHRHGQRPGHDLS